MIITDLLKERKDFRFYREAKSKAVKYKSDSPKTMPFKTCKGQAKFVACFQLKGGKSDK